MVVTSEEIDFILRSQLEATHTIINDTSGGCGQAFEAIIVSPKFKGKSPIMRHRLVNGVLKEQIAQIHAFTQRGFTPEEYARKFGTN